MEREATRWSGATPSRCHFIVLIRLLEHTMKKREGRTGAFLATFLYENRQRAGVALLLGICSNGCMYNTPTTHAWSLKRIVVLARRLSIVRRSLENM